MSCSNPNLVKHFVDPLHGTVLHQFLGAGKFLDPHDFGSYEDLSSRGWYITPVPCGKCPGCRCDRSREWANRMILELEDYPNAIFVTLTYRDSDLPLTQSGVPTLDHRDVQLFLKRLRKRFSGKRIRFFISGEYGSTTFRPHYHGIIYGLSLSDFSDLVIRGQNGLRQDYYTSPLFERIWSHGFVLLSDVSWHTCNYVARYVLKKQFGNSDEFADGRLPEYNVSSRRPGIGRDAAIRHLESGATRFSVNGRDGVYEFEIPSSILKRIKEDESLSIDNLQNLCYSRSKVNSDSLLSKIDASGLSWYENLQSDALKLSRKLKLLPERR